MNSNHFIKRSSLCFIFCMSLSVENVFAKGQGSKASSNTSNANHSKSGKGHSSSSPASKPAATTQASRPANYNGSTVVKPSSSAKSTATVSVVAKPNIKPITGASHSSSPFIQMKTNDSAAATSLKITQVRDAGGRGSAAAAAIMAQAEAQRAAAASAIKITQTSAEGIHADNFKTQQKNLNGLLILNNVGRRFARNPKTNTTVAQNTKPKLTLAQLQAIANNPMSNPQAALEAVAQINADRIELASMAGVGKPPYVTKPTDDKAVIAAREAAAAAQASLLKSIEETIVSKITPDMKQYLTALAAVSAVSGLVSENDIFAANQAAKAGLDNANALLNSPAIKDYSEREIATLKEVRDSFINYGKQNFDSENLNKISDFNYYYSGVDKDKKPIVYQLPGEADKIYFTNIKNIVYVKRDDGKWESFTNDKYGWSELMARHPEVKGCDKCTVEMKYSNDSNGDAITTQTYQEKDAHGNINTVTINSSSSGSVVSSTSNTANGTVTTVTVTDSNGQSSTYHEGSSANTNNSTNNNSSWSYSVPSSGGQTTTTGTDD